MASWLICGICSLALMICTAYMLIFSMLQRSVGLIILYAVLTTINCTSAITDFVMKFDYSRGIVITNIVLAAFMVIVTAIHVYLVGKQYIEYKNKILIGD